MSLILAGNVPTISYIVRYNTTEAKSSVKVKAEASNNKHKQQSNVGDRIVVARGDKHRSSNNGQTSEESTGRHEEASNAGQTIQVSILCQWCVSRRIMESWASRQRSEELTMSYLCIAITLCVLFHKKYDVVLDWSLSNHDHFYFPFHGSKIINHTHFIQPNSEDVVECKMDLPKLRIKCQFITCTNPSMFSANGSMIARPRSGGRWRRHHRRHLRDEEI